VADPRKQAARLGAEAMIDAGKDAARNLYDDLTLSDEEKEKREAERAKAAKRKRWKWIAYGVVALLAFLTIMMLLAKVGPYLLGLAVLAVLGFFAYRRIRRIGAKKEDQATDDEAKSEAPRPAARIAVPREKVRLEDDAETVAARAAATAAAKADQERLIDEELAALKRKARE
jgi:hypothetical protein